MTDSNAFVKHLLCLSAILIRGAHLKPEKSIARSDAVWLDGVPAVGEAGIYSPGDGTCATLAGCFAVNRRRLTIIYSGNVQGVGFRYTARTVANGFEVVGTVRNLPSGQVELIAEGSTDELNAFRQAIRDSGLSHFIRDEAAQWGGASGGFRGFEIVS